jgi:hypothetical protein
MISKLKIKRQKKEAVIRETACPVSVREFGSLIQCG